MGKQTFERWFGDRLFDVEINREELLGVGADLLAEAGSVSSSIGLIAELVGDYSRLFAVEDAAYRGWRAGAYLQHKMVEGKSPSEEVAKALVEAMPEFGVRKARLAEVEGDLAYLKGLFDALRVKATMVRARAEMQRGKEDGETVGFDTKGLPATDAERVASVKRELSKKVVA